MSNIQSYNALIDRFKAFASGHFILKTFSHGQIDTADLEKFTEYPFMHVVPSNVTYAKGTKTFSFQIVLADLPRDKTDKVEFQREVLSDLQRIAEDLIAEITNHRMLFGDLITVQNVSLEPFLEEFHNTLTGWTVSLDLLVPYYWDACSIPAEWNDFFESSTGGTGSILTFIDSITRDENGNVSLVNDEATPAPNYYYGTNDEGVRGWYLTTDNIGLTCETIGDCQTIIDIEAAIDALEEEIVLKADITSISAVGFSNDYNDLDNKPTIPAAQIQSDWTQSNNAALDYIKNKPTIPTNGLPAGGTTGQILTKVDATDYNATWQENFADWTSVVKHTVKNNGLSGTITKGTAVYVTGSNGTNMLVGRASNTSEATSSKTMGLMQSDITTTGGNQTGFVITEGLLEGLNTAGQTAGDPVWLGVNGALIYGLANKPYAPAHLVFIGIVTKISAGNGEIFVKVQNGFELKEIHDVDIITTTPINGHVLGFDGTLWVNKTVAGWLGFTPVTNARTISTTAPLSGGGDLSANRTLSIAQATTSVDGYLSSTDWTTFNGKQAALGFTAENTANKQNSLAVDGTGVKFPTVDAVNNLSFIDKGRRMVSFFTDFIGSSSLDGLLSINSGGGASITAGSSIPNRTNQQGVISFTTLAAATNYILYASGNGTAQFWFGGGAWNFETSLNISTLSSLTNRYRFLSGFGNNSANSTETDGVFFTYDEGGTANGAAASANWQCVTVANSVRTLTTTTTAVTAAAWNKLRIEINAAGTSVAFYVNGTLVATHTTNIPLGSASRYVLMKQGIFKTIGLTPAVVFFDYLGYENILTTPR